MEFDNKLKPKQLVIPSPIDEDPNFYQPSYRYQGRGFDHKAPYPNEYEGDDEYIGGSPISFPFHEANFNDDILEYQNYDDNTNSYIDNQMAIDLMNAAKGNPEYEITVYRVMPKTAAKINSGDWVTVNPEHAKALFSLLSKDKPVEDGYHIVKKKVKAKNLYGRSSEMDDINSYGYWER